MKSRHVRISGCVLLVAGLAVLPLGGCTTAGFSTFGNNDLSVANVADVGSLGASEALNEARAHFRNDDFGYSAALYKRVVDLTPNDPEGYIGLAASYDRLRRFDLADRVYGRLFEITGGTAQYYNNRGYSYLLRGDLKSAYEDFRKASALDPNSTIVANNLQILANVAAKARA